MPSNSGWAVRLTVMTAIGVLTVSMVGFLASVETHSHLFTLVPALGRQRRTSRDLSQRIPVRTNSSDQTTAHALPNAKRDDAP